MTFKCCKWSWCYWASRLVTWMLASEVLLKNMKYFKQQKSCWRLEYSIENTNCALNFLRFPSLGEIFISLFLQLNLSCRLTHAFMKVSLIVEKWERSQLLEVCTLAHYTKFHFAFPTFSPSFLIHPLVKKLAPSMSEIVILQLLSRQRTWTWHFFTRCSAEFRRMRYLDIGDNSVVVVL